MARAIALIAGAVLGVGLAACEPSSATDRERGMAEGRAIEAQNLATRPPLSAAEAVGCDVCPDWCRWHDLSLMPASALIAAYRRAAAHYEHIDRRTYDDAWEQLERFACIVRRSDAATQRAFVDLLDDPDPVVRYPAAVHALGIGLATDRAIRVLREFARDTNRNGSDGRGYQTNARIHLLDWDAGIPVEL
jgi:hypothetical protein